VIAFADPAPHLSNFTPLSPTGERGPRNLFSEEALIAKSKEKNCYDPSKRTVAEVIIARSVARHL
jgi:hypothetical protein